MVLKTVILLREFVSARDVIMKQKTCMIYMDISGLKLKKMRTELFSASFAKISYMMIHKKIKHREKIDYCKNYNNYGCPFEDRKFGSSIQEKVKHLNALFARKHFQKNLNL